MSVAYKVDFIRKLSIIIYMDHVCIRPFRKRIRETKTPAIKQEQKKHQHNNTHTTLDVQIISVRYRIDCV